MFPESDEYSLSAPERPGDDPIELTGWSCFLGLMVGRSVALVKLNLLFLLGCVPVATIPLSVYALNRGLRRIVRGEPMKCLQDFWADFRREWKAAYGAFGLTVLPLVFGGTGAWFYLSRAGANPVLFLPFLVCSTVFLVTLLSFGYLYGLLDGGRSLREALRLAVVLGITKPVRAVLGAALGGGIVLLGMTAFPLSGLYLLLLGFSLPCLVDNFFLRTVLAAVIPGEG